MDTEKSQRIYEAAQYIEENYEHQFTELLDVFHEADRYPEEEHEGPMPQYRVFAVVDASSGDVYTGPVCDMGREQGLYVYDHIVKSGYEVESYQRHDTDWEAKTIAVVRFGLDE